MLKVFVKEAVPYFLVSDGHFFVPAYFTREALAEYDKKFANVKVHDLAEKVILINNWTLELKKVDSNAVFTSYAGLEVRLIVHSFKPQLGEHIHPVRWPSNLYRDDEFKTTIQAFRHRCVQDACAKITQNDTPLSCKDAAANVVTGKDDWNFKEGTTAVQTLGGGKKATQAGLHAKVKVGVQKRLLKEVRKQSDAKKKQAGNARTVEKVLKFVPKKKSDKGKQSITGKKAVPSPGGKKSAVGTTDQMTMQTLKKFIAHKSGKKAVLGKQSAKKKSLK